MDITVDELKIRLDKGEKVNLIDVREPYEYEEFNMGGRLIPLGTLAQAADELEDLKHAEVIVHCRSGARSASAKAYLQSLGFSNVRNLMGGAMEYQMRYGK